MQIEVNFCFMLLKLMLNFFSTVTILPSISSACSSPIIANFQITSMR